MVDEERLESFVTEDPIIQNTILQSKSVDWYLYDRDLRHERVKALLLTCVH